MILRKLIRAADLLLLALFVAAAAVIWLAAPSAGGHTVVIRAGGRVYGEYPLDADRVVEIREDGHYNRIVIESGRVYMDDANCPDRLCVRMGGTDGTSVIACVPNRVIVEYDAQSDLDAVSQ